MSMSVSVMRAAFLAAVVLVWACGCAGRYMTPGAPADFRALGITEVQAEEMSDSYIAARMKRRPAAAFPAAVATARVQAGDYSSHTYRGWSDQGSVRGGSAQVITLREVESPADFERLAALPMIAGVAPVNRLVAPATIGSERDLRAMAAQLQADILLLYTLETTFETDTVVPVLGTITLGVLPSKEARVTCTASAAFIDTRTGFVYGLAEATADETQLANHWTTGDAIDQSRRRAETAAFGKLVDELGRVWGSIAARYGPPAGGGAVGLAR